MSLIIYDDISPPVDRRILYAANCGDGPGRTTYASLLKRVLYGRSTPLKSLGGKLVSAHSKSGLTECSTAASEWRRKQANAETYKTLAKCRAAARGQGQARRQRAAGNEAKAQAIEHRVASGGPVTQKDRAAKAKTRRMILSRVRQERVATKAALKVKGGSLPGRLVTARRPILEERKDDPTHEAILDLTRTLTGLEGAGPSSGYDVRDSMPTGARAYAKDQTIVAYGEELAEEYHAAMDKPPKDWDEKDARAVGAVIHEYIHTLGAHGYFTGDDEFLEEAATEILARHAVDQILGEHGATGDFRDTVRETGAYNGEVTALRLLADSVKMTPVEMARTLKGLKNDRRDRARDAQVGEWLGATGDTNHREAFGASFNHSIGFSAQLDRMISSYEALGEHTVDSYRKKIAAFRAVASEITPEVSKKIGDSLGIYMDWSRVSDTLKQIREKLKEARADVKGEAHTEWARTNQAKARAMLDSVKGIKSLSNKEVLKAFYVK